LTVETTGRGRVGHDLAWLVDLLWGPAITAGLARVTTDGTVPDGFVPLERFAVVPSLARPRFLVPLATSRAAWASTSRYNALRPAKVRAVRAALGAGMRIGVGQLALRDRLVVSVAEGAGRAALDELVISSHLRTVLDAPGLVMGIGVKEPHPNRKPTLQLFGVGGEVLGYVKVGWSELTRELVRNEAEALRTCAARSLPGLEVPSLLSAGRWNGLDLAVTSPLPTGVRRHRHALRPPPVAVSERIAAMDGTRVIEVASSPWWRRVRELVAAAAAEEGGEMAATLERAAAWVEREAGSTRLTFGRWHGDWVPWNLAWDHGRLYAWDWEHSAADAPLGFDLLHWQFQVAFIEQERSAAEAAARCAQLGAPYLARLGVEPEAAGQLPLLYLLEMYLRGYRMKAAGAGWNPRFHPPMLAVLAARAA
jgi:hypothetical protein